MRSYLKRLINSILKKANLRVVSAFNKQLTGSELYHDLALLINTQNPVTFDVGANEGQTIDELIKYLQSPSIYAFEPSSNVYYSLRKKYTSPNIHLHHCGLGETETTLVFNNMQESTLSSFLELDANEESPFSWKTNPDDYEITTETVQVKTIDQIIEQQKISHIDLLKIDTQGYDLNVLKGAKKALEASLIKYVLVEINFVKLYKHQNNEFEIQEFLKQHDLYLIDYYEKIRRPNQCGTMSWCTALFGNRQNMDAIKYLPPL